MSERIDHAAKARTSLVGGSIVSTEGVLRAQVHATLALVEEQRIANEQARIANLIALAQPMHLPGGGEVSYPVANVEFGDSGEVKSCELRPEIREALGL